MILLAGYALSHLALGPVLEPLLLLLATVAGCGLLVEVIRRISWLRPLFGLKPGRAEGSRGLRCTERLRSQPRTVSAGSTPK